MSGWLNKELININSIEITNPKKETKFFVLYSLFYVVLICIISLVIKEVHLPIFGSKSYLCDWWYLIIGKIIFLLVIPLIMYKKFGYEVRGLLCVRNRKLNQNIWITILFIFLGMLINLPTMIKICFSINTLHITIFNTIVGIVLPLFIAALPEEIFYRGILQTRIEKCYGWGLSILISSFLFTLFHFPSRLLLSSGGVIGSLIPIFFIGLLTGFLWNRYRNMPLLIGFHYGIDLLPIIASFWSL